MNVNRSKNPCPCPMRGLSRRYAEPGCGGTLSALESNVMLSYDRLSADRGKGLETHLAATCFHGLPGGRRANPAREGHEASRRAGAPVGRTSPGRPWRFPKAPRNGADAARCPGLRGMGPLRVRCAASWRRMVSPRGAERLVPTNGGRFGWWQRAQEEQLDGSAGMGWKRAGRAGKGVGCPWGGFPTGPGPRPAAPRSECPPLQIFSGNFPALVSAALQLDLDLGRGAQVPAGILDQTTGSPQMAHGSFPIRRARLRMRKSPRWCTVRSYRMALGHQ